MMMMVMVMMMMTIQLDYYIIKMNLLLLLSGYIVYSLVNNNNPISGISDTAAVHVYKIDHNKNTCGNTNTNTIIPLQVL